MSSFWDMALHCLAIGARRLDQFNGFIFEG
jgi:hypothetical protein